MADFALKIFDTTLHTLMEVRERLDPDALQRAITAMAKAERVEFYGFGASGAVATDAQHKFFRLLPSAAAYSDPHMQAMSAVTLADRRGDLHFPVRSLQGPADHRQRRA